MSEPDEDNASSIRSSGAPYASEHVRFPNALPIVDEYTEEDEEIRYHEPKKDIPLVDQDDEKKDPNYDEAQSLFDLANAYISMGDKEEAKETLEQAIKLGSEPVKSKSQKLLKDLD